MSDVNWWLTAVAFVLGGALTVTFTVRRVVREVPVREKGRSAGAAILDGESPD
ncbi:hypothetical protein [Mycolicibacterium sediminis]|uniref:Uncharacterized protein n=1 Tax=Mycolicibacterium sediminis TaxID=1286180 RepID=A0A7I7QZZ6_9MYCO|nr:hypothetical protein [Mycolicibacterium sediminis]BBY31875.1 hypothetical protein MSEDJ_59710 [Mycolicibacterium sediminis]